jgi:hypothetical protein
VSSPPQPTDIQAQLPWVFVFDTWVALVDVVAVAAAFVVAMLLGVAAAGVVATALAVTGVATGVAAETLAAATVPAIPKNEATLSPASIHRAAAAG